MRSFLVFSVRWIIAFVSKNEREVVPDSLIRNEKRKIRSNDDGWQLAVEVIGSRYDLLFTYLVTGDKDTESIVRINN